MNSSLENTKGLEALEFLTDKVERLLIQLRYEEKGGLKLQENLREVVAQKTKLISSNNRLSTKLSELQNQREKFDERLNDMLNKIGELGID